jgi:hypothetical protein
MRADLAAEDSVHGNHDEWSRLRRMGEVRWSGSNDVIKEIINSEDVLLEIPWACWGPEALGKSASLKRKGNVIFPRQREYLTSALK